MREQAGESGGESSDYGEERDGPRRCLRLHCSAKKDLARLMENPGIAVIEESCIFPEWACLGTSAVLHHWLRRVYGDCGLGTIVVVDSERRDLRLLINYAPTTRVLREHFHDCYSLTLMLHRSTSLHWFGEQLPLGTYF